MRTKIRLGGGGYKSYLSTVSSHYFVNLFVRTISLGLFSFLLAFSVSSIFSPVSNISAITLDPSSSSTISGSDTAPVSVSVSNSPLAYYISVSSSHGSAGTPVSLNYSQDGSSGGILGNVVSSSDNVYLETNSPLNHQLLLSTSGTHSETGIPSSIVANNLTGINTQESSGSLVQNTYIAPVGNTTTSSLNSATTLSSNTWGFALSSNTPGIESNNFDSDYSTTTNNSKFTTVPVNGSEVLLTQDTEPTSNTTIYYGVKADRDIPAGSYSNTVLYTALAEQPSEIRVCVTNSSTGAVTCGDGGATSGSTTPTIDVSSPHQTVTIYTSINTASSDLGTATVTFIDNSNNAQGKVEDSICTNPTISKDADNFLKVTCTSPAMPVGTYEVELTLDTFGRVLSQNNAISYAGTAPINNITTMQQMTTDICKTMPIGMTKTLQDTRGSYNTTTPANYGIIKAKDNNCWMTDNLNLYNRTVTSNDSNLQSGKSFTIPNSSTWGSNTYSTVDSYVPKVYARTSGSYVGSVWYTWCTAVAIESNCGTIADNQIYSICPKGWQLPVGGDNSVDKTYAKLTNAYNLKSGSSTTGIATTLGINKNYGLWNFYFNHGAGDIQERTQLWSSSPYTDAVSDVYDFVYSFTDNIYTVFAPNSAHTKMNGLNIRCVAR